MQGRRDAIGSQAGITVATGPIVRFLRPAGRFLRHFAEMCVAMCIGLGVCLLLFGGAALIGYSNPTQRFPEASITLVAVFMSLSMAGWMRFRRMTWRPTLEMVGVTVAAGILQIVALRIGLVPRSDAIQGECGIACVGMLAVMLSRINLYAGRATMSHTS